MSIPGSASYGNNYAGETLCGVRAAVKAYLGWIVSKGGATVPSYYSPLPMSTKAAAATIVSTYVGQS